MGRIKLPGTIDFDGGARGLLLFTVSQPGLLDRETRQGTRAWTFPRTSYGHHLNLLLVQSPSARWGSPIRSFIREPKLNAYLKGTYSLYIKNLGTLDKVFSILYLQTSFVYFTRSSIIQRSLQNGSYRLVCPQLLFSSLFFLSEK